MQGKTLSSRDIYGLLVTGGGAMESNPIILCSAIGKQSNPTVAYSETDKEYLIVWDDARVQMRIFMVKDYRRQDN